MPTVNFGEYNLVSNVLAAGQANPQPYPAFTGTQLAAYQAVCKLWDVSDVRAQYPNLTFDLDAHAALLTPQSYPGDGNGFSKDDWNAVCQELKLEIGAVGNVRQLYANFGQFNLAVFVNEGDTLQAIKDGLQLADTDTTPLWPGALVEGIFYAVFSALGPVGGFIANVVSAAWNTAQAAGTWNPAQQLQVEYQDILNTLLQNWNNVTDVASQQETTILQDWGMTQAVSALCGNQLASNSEQVQQASTVGEAQFAAGVLQMMMPGTCAITGAMFYTGTPPAAADNTWVLHLNNGSWAQMSLMMQVDNYANAVPSNLLDYIWAAGIPKRDVFLGQNGWQLPYDNFSINGWEGSFATDNDSAMLVFFINDTEANMYVNASNPYDGDETVFLPDSCGLPAGGYALFAAAYKDGPRLDFGVFSNTYDKGSVVSCTVSETVDDVEAGTISVSNANWVDGFTMSSVTVDGNWGSGDRGAPGVAVLAITN